MSVRTTQEGWPPGCCSSRKVSRSSGLCSRGAFWGPVHLEACSLSLKHTLPALPSASRGPQRARGGTPAQPGPSCWHRRSPDPVASLWGCALAEPRSRLQARVAPGGHRAVLPPGESRRPGRARRAAGILSLLAASLTPVSAPTQRMVCPGFPSRCTQGQGRRLAEQGDPRKILRYRRHHARGAQGISAGGRCEEARERAAHAVTPGQGPCPRRPVLLQSYRSPSTHPS